MPKYYDVKVKSGKEWIKVGYQKHYDNGMIKQRIFEEVLDELPSLLREMDRWLLIYEQRQKE